METTRSGARKTEAIPNKQPINEEQQVYGCSLEEAPANPPTRTPTVSSYRLPTEGQTGYILGKQVLLKRTLTKVSDLFTVIQHIREFENHQRVQGDYTQAFATTLAAKAIVELRLYATKVDHLTLPQWKNILAVHFRQLRTDLQDAIACLRKIPMEDVVPLSRGNRDYFQGNYRAIVLYLTTVEEYRTEIENLTGINVQMAKPEPSLVRDGGLSTVWQVTKEKLEFHLEPFTAIVTRGIQFRAMTTWEQIYQSIMGNVEQAITTYADNLFIFNTFEKIEREATRATYKRHQEKSYQDAKASRSPRQLRASSRKSR